MTRAKLLLALIAFATTSSGCAALGGRDIILHPIEKSDIVSMKKGEPYTPEKNGCFLSDLYMAEVQNAKVQQAKR